MQKKTHEDFIKEVQAVMGQDYQVIEEYKGARTPIEVRHICGHAYKVAPTNILKGRGCPNCAKANKAINRINNNKERILSIMNSICEKEGYEIIGEYKGTKVKIEMKHLKCGETFKMTPEKFVHAGNRCKCMSKSHGEYFIEQWLKDNDVTYETQVRFNDCRDKLPLPFDFKVTRKDGTWFLLEFDGKQHFEESIWEGLKERQHKDNIKTKYCVDNNIELYRIHYSLFERLSRSNNKLQLLLAEMVGVYEVFERR